MINCDMTTASPHILRRRFRRAVARHVLTIERRWSAPGLRGAVARFRPLSDQLRWRRGPAIGRAEP